MVDQFGRVGVLLFFALLFPTIPLLASFAFCLLKIRPDNPNPIKAETYECGVETEGTAWIQFNFRYYYFALLFVLFDVETIFLYPWAVAFRQLKLLGFVEALIFMAVLGLGLTYAWRRHALEWR